MRRAHAAPATASASTPLTFNNVAQDQVQATLDAHANESVVVNGVGYGPAYTIPGSGTCAQPPAQSKAFDRAHLSDATLASYGLPPHPTGPGATATAIASWTQAVQSAKKRVCTARPVFDGPTGRPVVANSYSINYSGYIDNHAGTTYSWVSANWKVPSVSSSNWNKKSVVWTGLGADGAYMIQGGTGSDVSIIGIQSYYAWYSDSSHSYQAQSVFNVSVNDLMYSDTYTPNCEDIQDDTTGVYSIDCHGPNASTGDADFIVERPSFNGGYWGLAKFGTVTITSTSDSQTDPDGDTHYGINMTTTGGSGGTACASPGSWVNEAFTVTWQSYC
jgi:hypothetical protein